MHDPHRKYKTCIFCNSRTPKLTNEHIFGKSVAKRFPLPNWQVSVEDVWKPELKKEFIKGGSSILSVGARCVCGNCNSGPLKTTLEEARPILLELAHGQSRRLTNDMQMKIRRYWERVAIILDVESSNHEFDPDGELPVGISPMQRNKAPILTQADRVSWRCGNRLSNVRVFAGHHEGFLRHQFPVIISPEAALDRTTGSFTDASKTILLMLGRLTIAIVVGADPALKPLPSDSFLQLDVTHTDVRWPLDNYVSYLDFFSLAHYRTKDGEWITYMNDPIARELFEAYAARNNGKFLSESDFREQIIAANPDGAYALFKKWDNRPWDRATSYSELAAYL